jgi:TRAP-type C4-dicarboxylate transport system substrate-binding protein
LIGVAVVLAFAMGPADAAKSLKLSLYVPLDSAQGKGAQKFKELVEQRSNGQLEVKLFPSNQLGGPYDVIDAQTAGSIEMSLLGYDIYTKFSPTINLAGLSFIFKDRAHAYAFYNSPLHEKAKAEILKNTSVRVLGNSEWNQGPYKILLTKDPILSTGQLKDVAMRVPNNEVDLTVWGKEGAGANVTPVPWPEAPLALKQGLVRAIELPADFVRPFKFYESAKYLALTRHRHQLVYMTIAEKVWKELTDTEREVISDANADAGLWYTAEVQKAWEADQEFLKSKGVVIIDFDVSAWHERITDLARKLEANGKWDKGLVDQVRALTK